MSVLLILGVVFFGIPLMARVSLVLDSLKGTSEPVQTENGVVLPPRFIPTYEATNSAKITIEGYGNEGETIEIFVNGEKRDKVVVSKEGLFSFFEIKLNEGENTITAIATGVNGKKSPETDALLVIYKNTPPSLEIETPKDGDNFSGEKKEIIIKGKTDTGTKVYINDRMAIMEEEGKFEFNYSLSEGENILKIYAIDEAGNKKELEIKCNYQK